MGDLVDDLISNPGVYVGPQTGTDQPEGASVARIRVTALPGGTGVRMDYEVLSPEHGVGHLEHAVLARTTTGIVLVTSHTHSDVTTVLRETEPGVFPSAEGDSPFPMKIELQIPEPGRLVYLWSHGMPGEDPALRDTGDLRRLSD